MGAWVGGRAGWCCGWFGWVGWRGTTENGLPGCRCGGHQDKIKYISRPHSFGLIIYTRGYNLPLTGFLVAPGPSRLPGSDRRPLPDDAFTRYFYCVPLMATFVTHYLLFHLFYSFPLSSLFVTWTRQPLPWAFLCSCPSPPHPPPLPNPPSLVSSFSFDGAHQLRDL